MLLLLVIKAKVQPFVALLLVSLLVALAAGIPAGEVGKVMIAGMGGVLGSVTIIIGLGAMLGRMIEHSGGAESLANYFSRKLGDKRTIAALTLAAFFLGIPVFFDVGFIILAPIIYGFAKVAKISPLKFGLPVAGIMLTVHVAVPPHPGPVAAAGLLHADIGWLTIIGIAISIPVGIVGYFAAKIINKHQYAMSVEVLEQMQLAPASEEGATKLSDKINPPGVALVTSLIVIPIAIIMAGTGFRNTDAAFASPAWYATADRLTNGSSNDCAGAGILVIGFTSRLELTTHQRHYGLSPSHCGGSDFGYWCWRGIWQSAGGIGRRQSPCQHATND
ncbi:inner membrane permease ygbN [Escherichia coli 6-537-08_S1_C3]|nr:inner membrane permease ygbN [Escherichia coli 6-537-08_S1_C3]